MFVRRLIPIFALLFSASLQAEDASENSSPFAPFLGEWKLKDDTFQQVWDGQTVETLTIPEHRTNCSHVNSDQSLLCLVDAGDFEGHILWAVAGDGTYISHLSHFGQVRLGDGGGVVDEAGNLSLTIVFSDEPENTFRHYVYRWISPDEYHMMSRQYDREGEPTGNWYGGNFVRVEQENP